MPERKDAAPSRITKGAYKMKSQPTLLEPDTIRLDERWEVREVRGARGTETIARRRDDDRR